MSATGENEAVVMYARTVRNHESGAEQARPVREGRLQALRLSGKIAITGKC